MITIDKTHNGKRIVTKKGDVNQAQLDENQTTGYLSISELRIALAKPRENESVDTFNVTIES
ncbi:hypothetical protein MASR2M47_23800 [Draconibacterium sp.]|jgi:hypothetical protein